MFSLSASPLPQKMNPKLCGNFLENAIKRRLQPAPKGRVSHRLQKERVDKLNLRKLPELKMFAVKGADSQDAEGLCPKYPYDTTRLPNGSCGRRYKHEVLPGESYHPTR